ncbi:Re/Si-specific NAD(P)(+) transhydrogenase subunit alpha, partial [Aduncisulcus paluster]
PPSEAEVARLREGQTLIGFLAPRNADNSIGALKSAGVQAFAVEAIPRISRAQVMDALSSQANVAGYKSVLVAASESTRFFPMLTTAAGTVKPALLLVLGVGVAGLQALATAKRLGARTTGYDVRPEVADQVRSVGAQWLDLGIDAAGEGGYARELTDEERQKQQQALEDAIKGFDVVITTALVPGRPAPRLVTAAALYAKNITSVLELLIKDGALAPDFDDEILLANIAILVLAGFVGFAVISKVPNTLHTPLMSGTNAIHGIVVLGAETATTLDWILIGAGLGIGVALGIPPALKTKMTAMPQLVALFNGVGGGTVALIAWSEFIETKGFSEFKPDQSPTVALVVGSLFAAVIGSV